jgi:hypothetical protein
MTEPSPPRAAAFGDFQIEIYLAGLSGTIPALPMDFAHLEARAASFPPARPPFWRPRPRFGRLSVRFLTLGVILVQNRRKSRPETVSTPRKDHLSWAGPPTRTALSPSCWPQPALVIPCAQ